MDCKHLLQFTGSICITVHCTTWSVGDKHIAGVFFLLSKVSKLSLAVIHGEKAVNALTAANISVYEPR